MVRKGNLFPKLIVLLTIVPLTELYILFQLAKLTSWWSTFVIVIMTGVVGAYLAKKEGSGIIRRIQGDLNYGRLPGDELINGLCVLVGGALLLTPGILTDITGLTLILPGTRRIYKQYIKEKLKKLVQKGNINFYYKQ